MRSYDETLDQIILNISDNGPGVPSADLPFIFDKGFTGEGGNYPGRATGMGLFLVRKMAQDLAIDIDAKSEPSLGLTISLIFPRVKY
ncbi:MAG: ATP-binding protein [Ruminiclostridium sp.]